MQETKIEVRSRNRRLARLAVISAAIVFVSYAVVLGIANDLTAAAAMAGSAANTVPTVLFGLFAFQIADRHLVGKPLVFQIPGHLLLAFGYASLTYWLLMIMLGILHGVSPVQFEVAPFPTRASAWQLMQNLTVYAVIGCLAHLHNRSPGVALFLDEPGGAGSRDLSRYFIKSGEDIRPIDVAEIISIAGADDYAEVVMADGRHLVRMTLAQFEKTLDPNRFIRVHRSRIVNIGRVIRAEPAGGGRVLLHMEDGETIQASRAGTRLFRERLI